MTYKASAYDCVFPEWTEQVFGAFEDFQIAVGDHRVLTLGIRAAEASNSVAGVTLTLTGGYDLGQTGTFKVPISSISGDMTFTDNVVDVVTVNGSTTQSLVIIENPPPVVYGLLEASTWPGSPNGSSVKIWASWR